MGKKTLEFDFGEILMLFRVRAKMSKRDVAKCLGVTPATIANYETAKTPPSYKRMLKFKKVFGSEFEKTLEIIYEGGRFSGKLINKYAF